ncbi:MAG TPA: hypothetical protein VLG76_02095 [Rhabdochlamydiaceae bacterium]|nr:hypothetical protein [Rhabdochlamydiaceae bacterium]
MGQPSLSDLSASNDPALQTLNADFQQLQEVENIQGQMQDELNKLILMSYTMKNSLYICELLYNALGDAKGEQAAQYGAINNIDSAMGNTNSDAQTMLNEVTQYLQGIVAPSSGGQNAAMACVTYDLNKLSFDATSGSSTFTQDWNQLQSDLNNPNLPSSFANLIANNLQALTTAYNKGNPNIPNFQTAAGNMLNTIFANSSSSNSQVAPVMKDLQQIVSDLNSNPGNVKTDCAKLSTDVGTSGLSSSAQQLIQSWIPAIESLPTPNAINVATSLYAVVFYGNTFSNNIPPAPPSPPAPPVVDPTKIDPQLDKLIADYNDLATFINAHPHLFGKDGAGATITDQINTFEGVFNNNGGTWGNADSMWGQIQGWLEQANGSGIAPQQLQTATGAIQSIDRSTDAQSTSSRMQADFLLNVVKQIIGGQESFVQAPLQAESGFVKNEKSS